MPVGVVPDSVVFGQGVEIKSTILVQLDMVAFGGSFTVGFCGSVHLKVHLISLDANHDGRAPWVFGAVGAFGFGKGF